MPQIWLTYDELADVIHCGREEARGAAATIPLDRRKCHDGHTRAKLTPALTEAYLDGMLQKRLERQLEGNARDLRAVHDRMAKRATASASLFGQGNSARFG
jgi:hypothetical protein